MSLSNYATLIQTGAVAKLKLDAKVKIDGTLAVKAIEVEPPQPDNAMPDLIQLQMPYIGVRCKQGSTVVAGTGPAYRCEYELQIRCVCEKTGTAGSTAALTLCQDMADYAVACLVLFNGVDSAIVSGSQVFMESATVGEAQTGEYENPYLAQSISIISAYVISI